MNLIDLARRDIRNIVTNSNTGFAKSAIFVAPDFETATVNVLFSEHNLSHDMEGQRVNSKNSHVSVSESVLTDLGYPTRDLEGKINLANLKENRRHSIEVEGKKYYIRESYPSKTTGLLVLILSTAN